MRVLILTVTLLSTAFAVPLYKQKLKDTISLINNLQGDDALRDSFLEGLIRDLIEEFRDMMIAGTDTIPVLDPFNLDQLTIDDIPSPGARVILNDVVVDHLSTFVINDLSVSTVSLILQRYAIEVDLTIPELDAKVGNYDLLINAMGFNVFGNGKANVKVVNPRVIATITAGLRISISGISVNLIDCKIKFSLDGFEPDITGLFNDDPSSSFVSAVLRHLVPDLVKVYEDDINDFLSELVFDILNDLL
ncbi:hypothetical protein K1T71_003501 [Dendrolimus kikuchii]|uniref:Uncharacterized protein n=1 Tax=Dendrolimus kikuchii TaxID=765133 RepID=A0ACC1DC88_9NEOP|nr:hypothetical protein K1T71_003501 [Dendrolimus kikuchii]